MIIHIAFGARHIECTGDIEYLQSSKIDVAPIHDIDGSGLWRDQIQRQRIAHFAVGNVNKTGDWAT